MVTFEPEEYDVRASRRTFLTFASGALAAGLGGRASAIRRRPPKLPKAILFDAFPIFDPRPVFARVTTAIPDKGAQLAALWRTRQFEYCWLRAAGARYEDFWKVTEDALVAAARELKIDLSPDDRAHLMQPYLELAAYPDVSATLRALRGVGVRLALLSNLTPRMLHGLIEHAGLGGLFEHAVSTDQVRTYKPDPRAYQLGIDILQLRREDVLFAAFAGWDVAGAKWFGLETFWVNRSAQPIEELGAAPDAVGSTLADLAGYLKVGDG